MKKSTLKLVVAITLGIPVLTSGVYSSSVYASSVPKNTQEKKQKKIKNTRLSKAEIERRIKEIFKKE